MKNSPKTATNWACPRCGNPNRDHLCTGNSYTTAKDWTTVTHLGEHKLVGKPIVARNLPSGGVELKYADEVSLPIPTTAILEPEIGRILKDAINYNLGERKDTLDHQPLIEFATPLISNLLLSSELNGRISAVKCTHLRVKNTSLRCGGNMSDMSNDLLIERVQEVMGDPHIAQDTKDLIQGYLDVDDWESIHWIITHLPEESEDMA